MPAPGDVLALTVERPAVGGAMIARSAGAIVLVTGAIPGERVRARVNRTGRGVIFATTLDVTEASPDRRPAFEDPSCGGSLYSHISYARQLELKGEVIADAFARIGRLNLAFPVKVAASREDGYRMRARLHVHGGRLGFFREGTHSICDPRASRQLLPETCGVLERLTTSARSLGDVVREVELSENIAASQRVLYVETSRPLDRRALQALVTGEGLTESPYVSDDFGDPVAPIVLRRHVRAFFQGNRYLIRRLVEHVVGRIPDGGRLLDLYAGVGLFSVTAARALASVTAVEGDRVAAADLEANAREARRAAGAAASRGCIGSPAAVEVIRSEVESFVTARAGRSDDFDVVIVDPPRTGLSPAALDGVLALKVPRVVYVSCDVATLARDSRAIAGAGYRVTQADAFDMFPNTPHVETVVVFDRATGIMPSSPP
jgi:23S rRNA (uracil1939-C5)-methyltransferase